MADLPNPFMYDSQRQFEPDMEALLAEIEPPPAFLASPRPEYLQATEIMPILQLLETYLGAPLRYEDQHP
jgi:hypothetical protein